MNFTSVSVPFSEHWPLHLHSRRRTYVFSVTSEQEIEIVESVAAVSEETTGAEIEKIEPN